MRIRKVFLILVILAVTGYVFSSEEAKSQLSYPKTERIEQLDTYNGVPISDPYRWLEDSKSEQTSAWVKSQDRLSQHYFNAVPERKAIRDRLAHLWNFDFYSTPIRAGRYYFFTKAPEGQTVSSLYKQQNTVEPQLILDPATVGKDWNIASFQPSPDGGLIACSFAKGQSRWREVKIVTSSGELKNDAVSGLHLTSGGVSWAKDGTGFYYVAFDRPAEGSENHALVQNPKVFYHRIGTNQAEDKLIYSHPDAKNWIVSVQASEDGRYVIIDARNGGSSKNRILYRDLESEKEITELLKDDAAYTYLGSEGTEFFFYTDHQAPNGRIIAVDINHPAPANRRTIIPESSDAIAGGSLVGGNAVGYYGKRFVILYWRDALPLLKSFDRNGKLQHNFKLPEGSSIWGGISGNAEDEEVFYALLTLTQPRTIYRVNLKTGSSAIFRAVEKDFDAENYVTKHIFYESKDGTRVPMFIVHKKGIQLNGRNPLFMYGYGAFGWNSFLWYQPNVLIWLERGGIYALPRIRGGGEYGENWHKAGIKQNKKNSLDDYIAAAEWLIQNGYTSPDRLVANGGSASAFLAATAAMKRPDLFGAALIDIPFLDLLRYDQYTGGHQFEPEFGSIHEPSEFAALRSLSPYHNVKEGQCYPAILVRVGELDQTAVPMHGYKFVAAMQAAQNCDRPILLKVMWGAGHNFGATPQQNIESSADGLAFLLGVLPQ